MEYTENQPEVTLSTLKEVMNLALKTNTLTMDFVQACADWLAMKEYMILSKYSMELHDRKIEFMGFDNRLRSAGHCNMNNKKSFAKIFLSKWLLVADNADGILNVLAHEVLHAILPFKERHGKIFKSAVDIINHSMDLQIRVVGVVGKITHPPVKYALYCPHCQKPLAYYFRKGRRVKHPNSCFCRACGSDLVVKYY